MAEEKVFENKIRKFLLTLPNTWHFKYWGGGYSKSGIPDIIACINGHFVAIEVKASNGHATELQKRNIELINKSGGIGVILHPKGFEEFRNMVKELIECKPPIAE